MTDWINKLNIHERVLHSNKCAQTEEPCGGTSEIMQGER